MLTDNLALHKTCQQKSNLNQYVAAKAVNGILDDFTHTSSGAVGNWWKVDLEKKFHVGSIKIHNRKGDNCQLCMYSYNRDSIIC